MDEKEARQKVWDMIRNIEFAMLVTECADGELRSRPMATQQSKFDGDLWFLTKASSAKVEQIQRNPRVCLAYADSDNQQYVSLSGTASLTRDRAKIDELWSDIDKAWFPQGKTDPDLSVLKVTVNSAEYWDSKAGRMVPLIGYAKAIVTGESYKATEEEHRKVQM